MGLNLPAPLRWISEGARARRAEMFRQHVGLQPHHRVLDFGGGDGSHFHTVAPDHKNVVIADILEKDLAHARDQYGYETVQLDGTKIGDLPFQDKEFDVLWCSSVIEHVTGPKQEFQALNDRRAMIVMADEAQEIIARELSRVTKAMWIQTPYVYFPVEMHTMLPAPFLWLPRRQQKQFLNAIRKFWITDTYPDWRLLNKRQMRALFPDADIVEERFLGLTKSVIAFRP